MPGVLGEIAFDHREVESREDRLLRFAGQQELERRLDEAFGRGSRCVLRDVRRRHRDVMRRSAATFFDGNWRDFFDVTR